MTLRTYSLVYEGHPKTFHFFTLEGILETCSWVYETVIFRTTPNLVPPLDFRKSRCAEGLRMLACIPKVSLFGPFSELLATS